MHKLDPTCSSLGGEKLGCVYGVCVTFLQQVECGVADREPDLTDFHDLKLPARANNESCTEFQPNLHAGSDKETRSSNSINS